MIDRPIAITFGREACDLHADEWARRVGEISAQPLSSPSRFGIGHTIIQLIASGGNTDGLRKRKRPCDRMDFIVGDAFDRSEKLRVDSVIVLPMRNDMSRLAECVTHQRFIIAPDKRPIVFSPKQNIAPATQ